MDVNEIILCSAIWYKDIPIKKYHKDNVLPVNCDRGLVFCGFRHCHCLYTMVSVTGIRSVMTEIGEYVQGFLTNKNRFVDRKEAYEIAFRENQIIGPNKGYSSNEVGLTSEDLY